jgi:hypothetical protein
MEMEVVMRVWLLLLPLVVACGDGSSSTGQDSGGGDPDGSMQSGDSAMGADGTMPGQDSGPSDWKAGNPNGSCSMGVPAAGNLVDVSKPTAVIGTGTPASCTFASLQTAVTAGGIITFNCGAAPLTIPITATMKTPINKNTTIDGGKLITLDGQGMVQILSWNSPNYRATDFTLTLQNIALVNGKTTPVKAIPQAPAPCSQGFNDGEGGALYMRDGNLVIINSIFTTNKGAQLGPDTGGGGVYVIGSKRGLLVVGSTFSNNSASNGGGIGTLQSELAVYNSLITGNTATGHDANNNEPNKCAYMNNGQNETGSGGNGGGLYNDGTAANVMVCGTAITNNAAGTNAFGGGIFFTSNDYSGTLSIIDSTIMGNTGGHWTNAQQGTMKNAGTAVGTNCKSLTITNSMVQGYP